MARKLLPWMILDDVRALWVVWGEEMADDEIVAVTMVVLQRVVVFEVGLAIGEFSKITMLALFPLIVMGVLVVCTHSNILISMMLFSLRVVMVS